jgi:hypothetical protein
MVAPFRGARELGPSSGQPVFFNLLPKHGQDKPTDQPKVVEALGLDLLEIRKLTTDCESPEPGDGHSP